MVFLVFLCFFNVFALVVVWELWRGLGISGKLPDALGDSGMLWGGSVRLVKGQMLSLNHQHQTATKAKTLKKLRKTTKTIDLTNDHSKNIEKTKKNQKNHRFQQLSQPRTLDLTPIVYEIYGFFCFSWFFPCFCIGSC